MSSTPGADTDHAVPIPQTRRRVFLLVVLPLAAALVGLLVYLHGGRFVTTENAYIKADKIPISAEISGTITQVLVRENQAVMAGPPLFRIDPAPFRIAVGKAEARLAQARTDLLALKASYREKQAEIALAHTRLAFTRRDLLRQTELAEKHFISAFQLDQAREEADLAAQQVTALEQDLIRIAETLGGSLDIPIERHPMYLSALAELHQAQLDLARVDVYAPAAGTVSRLPKPGQFVAAGSTAMALVVDGHLWIEANFIETDLTYVLPGQPVKIQVDTYPGVEWRGTVESLSPATGAEFAVIPAQNATGNWVKITQRVPVRIRIDTAGNQDPEQAQTRLRVGLSTSVEIDTGHRRHLFAQSVQAVP